MDSFKQTSEGNTGNRNCMFIILAVIVLYVIYQATEPFSPQRQRLPSNEPMASVEVGQSNRQGMEHKLAGQSVINNPNFAGFTRGLSTNLGREGESIAFKNQSADPRGSATLKYGTSVNSKLGKPIYNNSLSRPGA